MNEELVASLREALRQEGGGLKIDIKDLERTLARFDTEIKRNSSSMTGLFKEILSGKTVYRDLRYTIQNLDEQIDEINKNFEELSGEQKELAREQRQNLLELKKSAQQAQVYNAAQKNVIDGLVGFGRTISNVTSSSFKSLTGFASGVQSGSSAFSLAGGLMEGAIDAAHTGITSAAAGIGAVGTTAMLSTSPLIKGLGVAAAVAAPLISGLGDAAAFAGKFIVSYLVKETEGLVAAFQNTSAAGAMFANGMSGMYDAAAGAGLTVKQFSEVLKNNSENIAATGMSMSEGAVFVGKALSSGGSTLRLQLLNLGYSIEEQAGLVTDVMRDMTQGRGPLKATEQQVAAETKKYAENLRIISDITGEDARKKMAQVREQANQLAFQQKLAQKTPEQQKAVINAMANMSDLQRKSFMDMVNFGNVINEEGAVAMASSRGFSNEVNQTYQAYMNNTLDDTVARKITADNNEQIRKDLTQSNAIIGIAQAQAAGVGGLVGSLGKALGDELVFQKTHTKEAIEAAEKATKAQEETNDKLTRETNNAAMAMQFMALQIQNDVIGQLGKFAKVSELIIDELRKQLSGLEDMNKPGFWSDVLSEATSQAGTLSTVGTVAGGVIGATAGGVGAVPGAITGGAIGAATGFIGGGLLGAYKHLTGQGATPPAATTPSGAFGGTRGITPTLPPVQIPGGVNPQLPPGMGTNGRAGAGQIEPKLQELLNKIATNPLFAGATITSMNDAELFAPHAAPDVHGLGRAVDFKFPGYDWRRSDEYVAELKKMGFKNVLDEYIHMSLNRTGSHMHAQLKDGGIVDPKMNGVDATVAEGGQRELVTPLVNGMLPGMQQLIDKVDSMIDVLKDHKDISEKHLWSVA